jgi:diacylglycerol kinase (ATP)
MRTCAVVNPNSGNGRTGTIWPAIEAKLNRAIGTVEVDFTDGPMAAKHLTARALKNGAEQIIAVGGDGTVNEVVNGFFEDDRLINDRAVLALMVTGSGGDFRRTFRMPDDVDAQIERIAAGDARRIDLGKLSFIDHDGRESVRYFDNIASFGLSGAADMAFNRLRFPKKLGVKFAFLWATYTTVIAYKNKPVRIQVDDKFDKVINVNMAAVCNGQFFGGSMWIAPNAKPDDGLFDVIITHDLSTLDVFRGTKKLYKGKHMDEDNVTTLRGRRIVASPTDEAGEVLLDVDGEAPGRLPATFEILPNAIFLRC